MKVLFSANTDQFERNKALEALAIPYVQQVVDAYKAMRLPDANNVLQPLAALTSADLPGLFSDTASLVFDKMTGGQPVSISGVQVNKKKALEILIKPNGFDALLQAVESVALIQNVEYTGKDYRLVASYVGPRFELNNSGNVVFKAAFLTQLEESAKDYLQTDLAVAVNNFADDVIGAFEARGLKGKVSNSSGIGTFIQKLLSGHNEADFEKNKKRVLQFNNPEFRGNF